MYKTQNQIRRQGAVHLIVSLQNASAEENGICQNNQKVKTFFPPVLLCFIKNVLKLWEHSTDILLYENNNSVNVKAKEKKLFSITSSGLDAGCAPPLSAHSFFPLFCIYHSCPCHKAKLQTLPCNWYIIVSLLCHFSSSAPLDPLPVSLDVKSSGHNSLALEKHRGVCNYTWIWLPLLWSSLFNNHYMETLLWPLFNGPLAQFSFAPQLAAAV